MIQTGGTFGGIAVAGETVFVTDKMTINVDFGEVEYGQGRQAATEWLDTIAQRVEMLIIEARLYSIQLAAETYAVL